MATIQDWYLRIKTAIEQEATSTPGRAGETPLSTLAFELSRLDSTDEDCGNSSAALRDLVTNPLETANSPRAGEYWDALTFLVRYLPEVQQRQSQPAFRSKLDNPEMRRTGMAVYALHGYIAAGGRLSPDELDQFTEIKRDAPVAWLGAAVMSSKFEWVKRQTIELLRDGMLDLNLLLLGLDEWADVWQRDEDFENVVKEFRNASPKLEDKAKFDKWLKNRSYLDTTDQTSSPGSNEVPGSILQFGLETKPHYRSTKDWSTETDSHMRKLGAKGGKRRMETTTKEERQKIARKAGKASGKARQRSSE